MVTVLVNLLIKDKEDVKNPQVRQKYGMLCGMVGIVLNIFLFLGKFLAGTISHSISITADAFNNLSDAGSSCVTLVGFKMAGAKPDVSHPFGHGRIEYVAGLIVSGAIIVMAFELVRSSAEKILHPQAVTFSTLTAVILLISILVKIYMAYYNYRIGRKVDSAAMRATATDSLSDTCATAVVLIASVVGKFSGLQIDGYCGVLVGLFIFYAGISAARETLDPLLGQAPDEEFVHQIGEIVLSHEEICGIHDLLVHDYGPGRLMISLHAEVPAEGNILELHDVVDNIETELRQKLNCDAVIHMDPIVTEDEHILELKKNMDELIKNLDNVLNMHDFRVVMGPTHTNLIFDVVVPFEYKMSDEALIEEIERRTKKIFGEHYFVVIQVDKAYYRQEYGSP
ncbi:MAG: cation transporter [Lachnospiraceae bacterium]|nr:cation transporter [Lachnospiraceae bacterium]